LESQHHILMMEEPWQKVYIGSMNYKCKFSCALSRHKC
jgi:hypothetical protein